MKPRILALTHYYAPGFLAGGPVRSVSNLVAKLGDEFDWNVVTSDRDVGQALPYPGMSVDAWVSVGKARVRYASPRAQAPLEMIRLLRGTRHDVLYLNSFFDPRFSIIPALAAWLGLLRGAPILVAPRGEFSKGALQIKAARKTAFVWLARALGIYRNAIWHASTEFEASDILRTMGVPPERIHTAPVLSVPPEAPEGAGESRRDAEFRVCFLSRLSRKKNLDFALRVLAKVKAPLLFNIYGPKEDPDYWRECESIAARLPAHIRVSYEGAVPADAVGEVFSRHDLFFLPTRGENFGHVFLEAWAAGTTILLSDQTPWRDLSEEGVGWDLALDDEEGFVRAIENAASRSDGQRAACRARCLAFASRHLNNQASIGENRKMFEEALAHGRGR